MLAVAPYGQHVSSYLRITNDTDILIINKQSLSQEPGDKALIIGGSGKSDQYQS